MADELIVKPTAYSNQPWHVNQAPADIQQPDGGALHSNESSNAPSVLTHHLRRLELVLDYIDQNLAGDLCLEVLAQHAAISPFHFHRLFHAWTNETLSRFVRRRRLEVAAGRLRYCTNEKITAIALNCGFSSPEVFARVFRDHFGITPTHWRNGGWMSWRPAGDPTPNALTAMVKVTREEPAEYLFMRARGAYSQATSLVWNRFLPWVRGMGLGEQPLLLIGLDDPSITDPALCRMDACVQLPRDWDARGIKFSRLSLPARWVATLDYEGESGDIGRGWRTLLDDWLPYAPFDMGEGYFYQSHNPSDGPPDSQWVECKLCMPVLPKS